MPVAWLRMVELCARYLYGPQKPCWTKIGLIFRNHPAFGRVERGAAVASPHSLPCRGSDGFPFSSSSYFPDLHLDLHLTYRVSSSIVCIISILQMYFGIFASLLSPCYPAIIAILLSCYSILVCMCPLQICQLARELVTCQSQLQMYLFSAELKYPGSSWEGTSSLYRTGFSWPSRSGGRSSSTPSKMRGGSTGQGD